MNNTLEKPEVLDIFTIMNNLRLATYEVEKIAGLSLKIPALDILYLEELIEELKAYEA